MKKIRLALTVTTVLSLQSLFAQETIPTLTVDSTLTVGDSAVFGTNVQVGNDMRIMGETRMEMNALAGSDLTVEGNLIGKNNGSFLGTLTITGQTQLNATKIGGNLIVNSLPTTSTLSGFELVLVKGDGSIQKSGLQQIGDMMYSKTCTSVGGVVASPQWNNGPNKIFIACPEVKVGVGTITPLFSLDVRGNGYMNAGLRLGNIATPSYASTALLEAERSYTYVNPWLRFSVKKADGTNEIRFKVEPDGGLYCTSVRVRPTAAIPDYVFKPSYQLMPLDELRTFVTTNNHLPNIPNEEEIQRDGMSLDEMQLKLLEKVEELTLYVLEIHDENMELAAKNAELLKEIEALKVLMNQQH
jgi:hypothetical protein